VVAMEIKVFKMLTSHPGTPPPYSSGRFLEGFWLRPGRLVSRKLRLASVPAGEETLPLLFHTRHIRPPS
jgi:hypothetical protein